jgi:hypothetical protein
MAPNRKRLVYFERWIHPEGARLNRIQRFGGVENICLCAMNRTCLLCELGGIVRRSESEFSNSFGKSPAAPCAGVRSI